MSLAYFPTFLIQNYLAFPEPTFGFALEPLKP
jgi:hypothetical protein